MLLNYDLAKTVRSTQSARATSALLDFQILYLPTMYLYKENVPPSNREGQLNIFSQPAAWLRPPLAPKPTHYPHPSVTEHRHVPSPS